MTNLSEPEKAIIDGARAALNEQVANVCAANHLLQAIMELDDADDANIVTKPAARQAALSMRAALVTAITIIDGIDFPS